MGLFANLFDSFKAGDFNLEPNKKVKTVQREFKENFGLTLRIYKGKQFADGDLTLAALNSKTSKNIDSQKDDLKIKATMKIGDFEKLIDEHFGLTVQVANEHDTYCVANTYTLGQASRKEDLKDWCKEKGYGSIEKLIEKEGCKTLDEYYAKKK